MNKKISLNQKTLQLLVIAIFLFVAMAILRPDKFLRAINIHSMLMQLAELGLFSLCIALCYLSRGIDLSIVSIANLTGIVNGMIFRTYLSPQSPPSQVTWIIIVSVLVGIMIGALCGLINGFLIAELSIFPILVTLGTQNVFAGVAMVLTQGRAEVNFPQALISLGDSSIWGIGTFKGLPVATLIFLIVFIIIWVVVHKTPYGLKLQWYGSSSKVSFFSGIDNKKVVYTTYIISGLIAALAGLIIMARTNSAKADYGGTYVFQALLTCVLAGISPLGGRGKIYNLLLSLIALQIVSTGFNMMRVNPLIRDSLYGFLLVISIAIEYIQIKRKAERLNRKAISSYNNQISQV